MLFFPCIPESGIMKVTKETAYKPQGIRKEFLMRDALRDEMIKKICVRDTDNILDVGCGDGTFLHELTRWKDVEGYGIDDLRIRFLSQSKLGQNFILRQVTVIFFLLMITAFV